MSGLDDDALREMLAARADRLSPNTAGEVMVAVRAEVRGPRQGAAFSVLPVLTGRSPAIGAGWAAAAMIAVLVMVIVATRPPVAAPSPFASAPSVAAGSPVSSLPAGIPKRTAVELAGSHFEGPSTDPLGQLIGARAGAYADVSTNGALEGAASIDPTRLVWAVTFTGFGRQTVYLDYATGAYLGTQHDPFPRGPSQSPAVPVSHIAPSDLLRVVNDGSYDGRLVLVNSTLRASTSPLCDPAPCPLGFALDFVGGVVTTSHASQPVVPATPDPRSMPLTGTFVVVPWKGTLILLGRLEGSLGNPVAWTTITSGYVAPDPGAEIALQAVSGWLTRNVALPCASVAAGSSACGPVDQLTNGPFGSGGLATTPRVDAPALGLDATATEIAGPFLVRTGTGAGLEIVGRYDEGAYTTVDTPTVTCDIAADSKLPSCDKLVVYALQPMPDGAEMTSIEVHQGDWTCPSDSICASAPPEQRAWVLVRSTAGDWEVGLTFDAGGYGVDIVQIPLPSSSPVPSAATVTCGLDSGAKLPPCNQVVAEALAALQSTGSIQSIEVGQGAYCPPGTACPTVAPDRANVILRTSTGDWLVDLAYGPDGKLVSAIAGPLPSTDPTPSSVPTTCTELGYGQTSTLTCDAAVAAALKVVPAGTAITSLEFRYTSSCPPWLFCALRPYDPNAGAVIVHVPSPGRDLWVTVRADAAGIVTVEPPIKFPAGSTAPPAP